VSTLAERQRRFRARQRAEEVVVPVIVSNAMLLTLIDRGWLDAAESESREKVGEAVAAAFADLAELPTKNSVTRYGRKSAKRGMVAANQEDEQ
jgi:hypothetical protein